jgi:hypothetical protein
MQMNPRQQQGGMEQIASALGQPATATQGVVAPGTPMGALNPGTAMPTPSGMVNKPMPGPMNVGSASPSVMPQMQPGMGAPMAAPMARPQGVNAGELGQPWGLRFGRPGGR